MSKPVKIKFRNKTTGKIEVVSCHDPATCREHSWLARAWKGYSTDVIEDFHGVAKYEDEENVSLENYMNDSMVKDIYDDYTQEVVTNDSYVSVNPFGYAPNTGVVICDDCGEELEYRIMRWENEQYDGREHVWVHKNHPELNFFRNPSLNKNLHIEGEGTYNDQPVSPAHHSKVPSWCRRCGTLGSIVVEHDPWADNVSCSNPECDYKERYSLGD